MDAVIINIILWALIIILLVLLTWVWPPDSPWSPWWRTSKRVARIMCRLAKVSSKDVVYDLGSGDGSAIIVASKEFGAKAVGIEIDFTRCFIAQLRLRWEKVENVVVVKDNFHNQDLSKATVVFIYLVPRVLKKIVPKLLKELKPGTRIVSYVYTMNLPVFAKDTKEKIYVYKIPKKINNTSKD